jgi:hypothetical protein
VDIKWLIAGKNIIFEVKNVEQLSSEIEEEKGRSV